MKIVAKDNFDRDYIPDQLVAENVNEFMGNRIVNLLNSTVQDDSPTYYFLEEDDYELLTIENIYC